MREHTFGACVMGEPDVGQIEQCLMVVLNKERREAVGYAIAIVLCTPAFVALASFTICIVIGYVFMQFRDNYDIDAAGLYTGFIVFLAYMIVFVLRYSNPPEEPHQFNKNWIIAVALFLLLLFLTYSTELLEQNPVFFGLMFTGIGFLILGLTGRVYMDMPMIDFTKQDDTFWGFILAISGFIAMAYGELFSSSWLWIPPKPDEVRVGAWILHKLVVEKSWRIDNRRGHGRALNYLLRLKLAKVNEDKLEITEKGLDLIRKENKL